MQIGQTAMYTGSDAIMQAVDTLWPNNPYYSVWLGRDLMFQYSETDIKAGRAILRQMLDAAEQQENCNLLTIKFHPKVKGGYITNKSDYLGTMHVRACELETGQDTLGAAGPRPGDLSPGAYYMMKNVNDALTGLTARLTAIEAKPAEVSAPDIFDRIGSILEKPGVPDALVGILSPIIQRFIPGANMANLQVSGVEQKPASPPVSQQNAIVDPVVANIAEKGDAISHDQENKDFTQDENEIMDKAIYDLSNFCDPVEVLPLLAEWAAANTAMFVGMVDTLKSTRDGKGA